MNKRITLAMVAFCPLIMTTGQTNYFSSDNAQGYQLQYEVLSEEEKTVKLVLRKPKMYSVEELIVPEKVVYKRIEYSVEVIGSNAFLNFYDLFYLVLPPSIKQIETNAFTYLTALRTLFFQCTTPPVLGENVFVPLPANVEIGIPKGSESAYANSDEEQWQEFFDRETWGSIPERAVRQIKAWFEGDNLHLKTPNAVHIKIYSLQATLLYQGLIHGGETVINLPRQYILIYPEGQKGLLTY